MSNAVMKSGKETKMHILYIAIPGALVYVRLLSPETDSSRPLRDLCKLPNIERDLLHATTSVFLQVAGQPNPKYHPDDSRQTLSDLHEIICLCRGHTDLPNVSSASVTQISQEVVPLQTLGSPDKGQNQDGSSAGALGTHGLENQDCVDKRNLPHLPFSVQPKTMKTNEFAA